MFGGSMFGGFGPDQSGRLGQVGVVGGPGGGGGSPSPSYPGGPGGFPGIYPGMGPGQSGMAGFNQWVECLRMGLPPGQCPPVAVAWGPPPNFL